MRRLAFVSGGLVAFYIFLRLTSLQYLYYREVGITFNPISGQVGLLTKTGWNILPPWVLMSRVDIKPMRVCITSAGRGVNCKLVKFESSHYQDFISVEGFHLYWWYNRLSFNFGYNEEYRGMKDIMRGYAFGVQKYPFITVLNGYNDSR